MQSHDISPNQVDISIEPIETEIYWRSDRRLPNEVFKNNFKTRNQVNNNTWWHESIRIPDALPENCICMTSNFASAGIFPIIKGDIDINESHASYLYAIALPKAVKIDLYRNLNSAEKLIPQSLDSIVIDLHSFQKEYAKSKLKNNDESYKENMESIKLALCLYAYEKIAYQVSTANIIAAVKMTRKFEDINTHYIEGMSMPAYSFKVDEFIHYNLNFKPHQKIKYVDINHFEFNIDIDYTKDKTQAIEIMENAALTRKINTPIPSDGLKQIFTSPIPVFIISHDKKGPYFMENGDKKRMNNGYKKDQKKRSTSNIQYLEEKRHKRNKKINDSHITTVHHQLNKNTSLIQHNIFNQTIKNLPKNDNIFISPSEFKN